MHAKALNLSKVLKEIDEAEAEKKSVTRSFKDRLDDAKGRRKKLQRDIEEKTEERYVDCYEDWNFRQGIIYTRIWETDLAIDERAMTAEERQTDLADLFERSRRDAAREAANGKTVVDTTAETRPAGPPQLPPPQQPVLPPDPDGPRPEDPKGTTEELHQRWSLPLIHVPGELPSHPKNGEVYAALALGSIKARRGTVVLVEQEPDETGSDVLVKVGWAPVRLRAGSTDMLPASHEYRIDAIKWTNKKTFLKLEGFEDGYGYLTI